MGRATSCLALHLECAVLTLLLLQKSDPFFAVVPAKALRYSHFWRRFKTKWMHALKFLPPTGHPKCDYCVECKQRFKDAKACLLKVDPWNSAAEDVFFCWRCVLQSLNCLNKNVITWWSWLQTKRYIRFSCYDIYNWDVSFFVGGTKLLHIQHFWPFRMCCSACKPLNNMLPTSSKWFLTELWRSNCWLISNLVALSWWSTGMPWIKVSGVCQGTRTAIPRHSKRMIGQDFEWWGCGFTSLIFVYLF